MGFVSPNHEVRDYSEKATSSMVQVASNILMDETDESMWDVTTLESGEKCLVRRASEDVGMVLSSVRNSRVDLGRIDNKVVRCYASNYVAYVNADGTMDSGFVMSSENGGTQLTVLTPNDKMHVISSERVAHISEGVLEEAKKKEVAALTDPQKLKDYYAQVYEYNPDYFAKISDIIDSIAAL